MHNCVLNKVIEISPFEIFINNTVNMLYSSMSLRVINHEVVRHGAVIREMGRSTIVQRTDD